MATSLSPHVSAIGYVGTIACAGAVLFGPSLWSGTVNLIDSATAAGAAVVDTVGKETVKTVQETAAALRACLRTALIGGSSAVALACASLACSKFLMRRPAVVRAVDGCSSLVAAVRTSPIGRATCSPRRMAGQRQPGEPEESAQREFRPMFIGEAGSEGRFRCLPLRR